jgi:hypothetical protein
MCAIEFDTDYPTRPVAADPSERLPPDDSGKDDDKSSR